MRLELADFPVSEVQFSGHTRYNKGVLEVDKEQMLALVLEDKKIVSAALDVAFPGEKTRIVQIRDVVEPRVKVSGPGCVFPGILGPVKTVGEGRTNRLSGVTQMVSGEYPQTILNGTARGKAGLVDMWGSGSLRTPYGSKINIVLILKLIDGVTELQAHTAFQLAEFKVARRLAEATREQTPESLEVFDTSQLDPGLPRIVYLQGCNISWHHPCDLAYYGLTIRESLPTLVHPTEFIDGAITTDGRRGSGTHTQTWEWMNAPVIFELLREHGKRLNFIGVILQRTRWEMELGKQVAAESASQIARLLGADGAVITRQFPSGNNFIDSMLTVQACELKGIKTVFLTPEWGGKDGTELPLIFYVPEATAMISSGSTDRGVNLQAPTRVIGVEDGQPVSLSPDDPPISPLNELTLQEHQITGGIDWWGFQGLSCKQY